MWINLRIYESNTRPVAPRIKIRYITEELVGSRTTATDATMCIAEEWD